MDAEEDRCSNLRPYVRREDLLLTRALFDVFRFLMELPTQKTQVQHFNHCTSRAIHLDLHNLQLRFENQRAFLLDGPS